MNNSLKEDFQSHVDLLNGSKVALDVDGTLTEGLGHSAENNFGDLVEFIKFLYDSGVEEVFLATGRPPWSVVDWVVNSFDGRGEKSLLERFMNTRHVMFDGAIISDLYGNAIYERSLCSEFRKLVCELLDELDVKYSFDTRDAHYMSLNSEKVYFMAKDYYGIDKVGSEQCFVGYLSCLESEDEALELIEKMMGMTDKIDCHYFFSFQGHHCVSINPRNVNKMKAIDKKMEIEGDFERLIFFGDGSNDIPVFERALVDQRIIAIPSPHTTQRSSRLLGISKWNKPEALCVHDVLKF